MKKFLCWLLPAIFILSCNNNKKAAEALTDAINASVEKVIGSFVGSFGDNKITLLITSAEANKVDGRTIVGGNDRPFTGTITFTNGRLDIVAKEPGDDPNDGVFQFSIDTTAPDIVVGSWKAFDVQKGSKSYRLERKTFSYSADVGEYPQASQRELKPEDVENMMKTDLDYMRNEIFARHGYSFKKKDIRELFQDEDWYVPNNVDVKKLLTPVEVKNIALIKRYAAYADDYSDEFGR